MSDLKVALAKYDVYFREFDRAEASFLNHLPMPRCAFYGRSSELSILMSSLQSVLNFGRPMITTVSGRGG